MASREIVIDKGFVIPIEVHEEDGKHVISVDNVEWLRTDNKVHAAVLFNMMAEHLPEYMNYAKSE
jgi:hypothetical protein